MCTFIPRPCSGRDRWNFIAIGEPQSFCNSFVSFAPDGSSGTAPISAQTALSISSSDGIGKPRRIVCATNSRQHEGGVQPALNRHASAHMVIRSIRKPHRWRSSEVQAAVMRCSNSSRSRVVDAPASFRWGMRRLRTTQKRLKASSPVSAIKIENDVLERSRRAVLARRARAGTLWRIQK